MTDRAIPRTVLCQKRRRGEIQEAAAAGAVALFPTGAIGQHGHLDIPRLVELYLDGRLKLDELISRTSRLEEINEGCAAPRRGEVARGVVVVPA